MRFFAKTILFILVLLAAGAGLFPSCRQQKQPVVAQLPEEPIAAAPDSAAIRTAYASSPVFSPEESLAKLQVEEGFAVQLVAAEPLVHSPVAMTFDDRGRLWVVEMQGYMPDTAGTGEENPTGKIVILEDEDQDGKYDVRRVFLDSLVLPRALCFVENGLLVAEPPNLWFVEIDHDKPGKKTLVDGNYSVGGNVEHEPNGLVRALDNWIYNAKSAKRYRKQGDKWLVEKTHFRGQWGLSQDNYGRLYYNNNSQNLLGDFFPPGFGATNKHQQTVAGYNENVVPDNRVYPARPNLGVNRGYQPGILDERLRLVNFTAACSPVVYRGDLFNDSYRGNAFVAEPAANLIKRNILQESGYTVQGKQAYEGKEFLASTDERFRPVSLYNGPDGALYLVDMYRGIIQHEFFLTHYLANEIKRRKLEQPISCGRIYKIVPEGKHPKPVTMPAAPEQLVALLGYSNGWVRDRAQQLLVDNKYKQTIPALRQNLTILDKPLTVIHSLWTLEGLGALQPADVQPLLHHPDWHVRAQAISVLPSVLNKQNYQAFIPALEQLLQQDSLAAPYIAYLAHLIKPLSKATADRLLQAAVQLYLNNVYVADAVISNLQGREADFLKQVTAFNPDTSLAISMQLRKVMAQASEAKKEKSTAAANLYPKGAAIFKTTCQACHGPDGNGTPSLAPPLNKSEWVQGSKHRLVPLVLFGLTGPVKVNGKVYQAPEINGDMPGIGSNIALSDEDVAELLNFIRNAWSNSASDTVEAADVSQARLRFKSRQEAFTTEQLEKL